MVRAALGSGTELASGALGRAGAGTGFDDLQYSASMDLGAVDHAPATNLFLVKLSHWWGG